MNFVKNLLLTSLIIFSPSVFSLVDYTENDSTGASTPTARSKQRLPEMANQKSLAWKADYSLITNYESLEMAGEKLAVMNIAAHVQTPLNIFFDASYWSASGTGATQSGNPRLLLGFNWLRMGAPSEEARINLYGGARLPSNSKLATSRTDKIFGAETTKRFGTFGLGLGYEMTLVGRPKSAEEVQIGNVTRLSISGGWMVSNDIQFEVEAENFKIARAQGPSSTLFLGEDVSFSTLSPKLNLGLASALNLELGARFRLKKVREGLNLARAGVFDLHGAHANSLFAGLNLSI